MNWRRVSKGCGIRYEDLASANTALRPIFLALAADLAKPGPRKAAGSKRRNSAKTQPPKPASQPAVVPLPVGRVTGGTSPANDEVASLFSQTLDATMREHRHTAAHLLRVLDRAGEQVELSTLRSWQTGRKAAATADSLRQLGVIEAHYALPTGSLKEGLPHRSRAIKGHAVAGVSSAEMRRLAWHLPDDFGERSVSEQETILEWVRTRIIAGSTDYRRFQAAAMKHRYSVKFPDLHGTESSCDEDQDTSEKDPDLARACRVAPRELAREMGQLLAFKTSTLTAPGYQRRDIWGEETASQRWSISGSCSGRWLRRRTAPVRGRGVLLGDL